MFVIMIVLLNIKERCNMNKLVLFSCAIASLTYASEQTHQLDSMVVTATKTPHTLKDVPVETIVITSDDIEASNAQNISGLFSAIPGITNGYHNDVFGTYTWRASMRGLSFDGGYGLILIDGERVLGAGQSGGMGEGGVGLNQIPLSMVERVEIVKGAGSALYGSDAMAGVINIITKKGASEPSVSANVTCGQYNVVKDTTGDGDMVEAEDDRTFKRASITYQDGINDRFSYMIGYSFDGADDMGKAPLPSSRHSFMGSGNLKVSEKISLRTKLEFSDYEKAGNRTEESYRISMSADISPVEEHSFTFGGYRYVWDFELGYPGNQYGHKLGEIMYEQGNLQYTGQLGDKNTLVVGGEFYGQTIDYGITNADGSKIGVDKNVKTYSAFAQNEFTPIEMLTLIGAIRYDNHSFFGDQINPKANIMLKLSERSRLRASVGRSFKSPTIRQLYYNAPYKHGGYYAVSNPNLKPEIGLSSGASFEQFFFDDRLLMNVGYFYNKIDDMVIREEIEGEEYNGLPVRGYDNVESATTQGLEFLTQYLGTKGFSGSLSYTLTATENETSGKRLTYVPMHDFGLRGSYEWEPIGVTLSLGMSAMGEQFTNSDNTKTIDAGLIGDAKLKKTLSDHASLSLAVDDIFESAQGRTGRYHRGRSIAVSLNTDF